MKLISVCVGLPREVSWKGKPVTTGIFKQPVAGRVRMRSLNLDGDQQADLTVHGSTEKAIYAYSMEHYAYWRQELPNEALPWGAFGENLTTEGLSEKTVNIGDRIAVRFEYEWHDDSGFWYRSYGNENWEFAENGLMRRRFASINDVPIQAQERKFHWERLLS